MRVDLYGAAFDCECGRRHAIEPETAVYADDATERLAATLEARVVGRRVIVLTDARTRAAAGDGVAAVFAARGWTVLPVEIPDPAPGAWPVCDDGTKASLESRFPECDVMAPVGAGVVCDLGKWIACDRGLPFVSFATAASMNGYASANVAPTIAGVKTLARARAPLAVGSWPAVLRDAPYELTTAGLGDLLAKSVSSADWRLNALLFGDYYCARSVDLIAEIEPLYLDHPDDVRARAPRAIEALFEGLLLTGVAMTMAESSAPASGGEHLISHSLDMLASASGGRHDLHGRQVGVGTILMAELYRRVMAVESPALAPPADEVDRAFWGPLSDEVAGHFAAKAGRLEQARQRLAQPGEWDRLRAALAPMPRPPEVIAGCLRQAGAACRADDIGVGRERLRAIFERAHQIRSRFTILDLARLAGVAPSAAGEIVEQWG